jgi:hypothetical protein
MNTTYSEGPQKMLMDDSRKLLLKNGTAGGCADTQRSKKPKIKLTVPQEN